MTVYPKIETLFDRGDKFKVIEGAFRRQTFSAIDRWLVTEKVDGTNIRLTFVPPGPASPEGSIKVQGKTDNASLHPDLLNRLTDFTQSIKDQVTEICDRHDLETLTLYGEGYGTKIQSGGYYRSDQGFILFDVLVDDRAWLDFFSVQETADQLFGCDVVPLLGVMTTQEAVEFVKRTPNSTISKDAHPMEGVVARPLTPLYDRRGERVIWKLKVKDFA